jgi:hypothetical protein
VEEIKEVQRPLLSKESPKKQAPKEVPLKKEEDRPNIGIKA